MIHVALIKHIDLIDDVKINQAVRIAMQRIVLQIEAQAKKNAPVRTGTLRRSITSVVNISGNKVIGKIGTNLKYAAFVEYGTKRMKGRKFITRAVESYQSEVAKEISREIRKITNG